MSLVNCPNSEKNTFFLIVARLVRTFVWSNVAIPEHPFAVIPAEILHAQF